MEKKVFTSRALIQKMKDIYEVPQKLYNFIIREPSAIKIQELFFIENDLKNTGKARKIESIRRRYKRMKKAIRGCQNPPKAGFKANRSWDIIP